jgi:PilZ domain
MSSAERRGSERLVLAIPIRVIGFDAFSGEFSEETETRVVNQGGACIVLDHRLNAGDAIHIINLKSYSEADFRVVGPTQAEGNRLELGVECIDVGRNIWGMDFATLPGAPKGEAAAVLECRGCKQQANWPVTLMESEVLGATGQIVRECNQCGKRTYWVYADPSRRPRKFAPSEPTAPPPRAEEVLKNTEKRTEKRLGMRLSVRVRSQNGEAEISKTDNVSKKGFGASLTMDLYVGDIVFVMCPYTGGQDIEQKAEVRRRPTFEFGGRRTYGFRYIR